MTQRRLQLPSQTLLPASLGFVAQPDFAYAAGHGGFEHHENYSGDGGSLREESCSTVANQDENLMPERWIIRSTRSSPSLDAFYGAKLNQSSTFDGKNPLSINNYGLNDLDYGLALGPYLGGHSQPGQFPACGREPDQRREGAR